MKTLITAAIVACCISSHVSAGGDSAETVGVRDIAVHASKRPAGLTATIWYPAQAGGREDILGESAFFVGTPAMRDAPIASRRYPVILLSHGAGIAGTASALSWLAVPLAQRGFIVAAPTHPGNGGANRSAAEVMRLWQRPADISATLDALEKDSLFSSHIVQDKVGMLGLSMGGGTALAIGGARFDPEQLAGYCDTQSRNPSLCEWIRLSGVDLHAMDMSQAGRDNRDARIRFVMAIDPAPMDAFAPGSFAQITTPTAVINLGHVEELPSSVRADKAARVMPQGTYATIEDASHYSMFPECKAGAKERAEAEEIGDPICSDGGGQSRSDIHKALIKAALQAFDGALQQGK